jgi:hypothetical protein
LCAAAVTVWGCRTTYEATAPRLAQAGDVRASIEVVRGTRVAEVRVTGVADSGDTALVLKAARLGAVDQRPCASKRFLDVVAESGVAPWDEPRPLPIRSNERIEIMLPTRLGALSQPGLTLDLAFSDEASGCARLPLTATADEVLWRGSPGWGGSGHLRVEWPMASAGGVGAGLTAEMRFHHPVRLWGDWQLSFGLPFGWTGCRGDCPALGWRADNQNSVITGIFYNVGATASVARVVAVGRWLLLPAVGFRTSAYLLGASSAFEGDRSAAVVAGPFASLGILRERGEAPPGFQPLTKAHRGIELTVGALGAYGRTPGGTVWLLGVGWTFVDVD